MTHFNFQSYNPKLKDRVFLTIRDEKKAEPGEIVEIQHKRFSIDNALVLGCVPTTPYDIPASLLTYDTNKELAKAAMDTLLRYYPGLDKDATLYIYTLCWLDGMPTTLEGDQWAQT